MAKKPSKIGKNAPCPCGSGKAYKRCCLTRQGPGIPAARPGAASVGDYSEADDAHERYLGALRGTLALPERLGWENFDFGVDLLDPVVDDVLEFTDERWTPLDDERAARLTLQMAMGLERHATPEVRSRAAGAIEEHLARRPPSRVRELLRAALSGVEDLSVSAMILGFFHPLYHEYMFRRARERLAHDLEETNVMQAELRLYEKHLAEGNSSDLETWLSGRGEQVLPWLEHFARESRYHGAILRFLGSAGLPPSMRAANLLVKLALGDGEESNEAEIVEALGRVPRETWPILLYRARHRATVPEVRLRSYQLLASGRRWEVLDSLLEELTGAGRWTQNLSETDLPKVATLLTRLGDRRAVGQVIGLLAEEVLSDPARGALQEAWAGGWWEEVQEALAAHKRGVLVLVPRGSELSDLIQEKMMEDAAESIEALQFRTGILNEEWNHVYHEDLEGLRPSDLAVHGPDESRLMGEFAEAAKARVAELGEGEIWREDLRKAWGEAEYALMRTPHPGFAGRIPLAVIWEERRQLTPSPGYYERQRQELLNEMYLWTRDALEEGDREGARRELDAILAVEPDYPFARRLLATLG